MQYLPTAQYVEKYNKDYYMKIRLENINDYIEVENLTREAFWNLYRPGCFEHFVLHNLRKSDCFIPELDYVIEENGKIIAHIVYAKAYVKSDNGETFEVGIFGPVSVLPELQGKGYGSKLIQFTLNKAKETGIPLILICGNPAYYPRFGFESASRHGIYYEGLDKSEEAPFFMVKVIDEEASKKIVGTYSDPECYQVSEEETDEFDKNFPLKVKEKREGQLV